MFDQFMATVMTWPILSLLLILPLVAVAAIAIVPSSLPSFDKTAKTIALVTTLLVFVLSLVLLNGFNDLQAGFQFTENKPWLPSLKLSYHVGIDGISLWFVLLSTFLTPICILASWSSITKRVKNI